MGPKVKALEAGLAAYSGTKHVVAVSNGTAALDVAMKALEVRPGDEVIVPALTYIATVNAVSYNRATPILADVDPWTFNLDPTEVRRRLTPRTKVIVPIDYGGMSCANEAIEELSERSGATFLKDGAHSLGGFSHGRSLLAFGKLATLSLHTAKVMTSIEGGAIFTDDDSLAQSMRMLRNQGEDPVTKYYHPVIGHNYRMSDVHAGFGLAQLSRLDSFLEKRREIAAAYSKAFREDERIEVPRPPKDSVPAYFFYPVLVPNRDAIVRGLKDRGIETRVGWPWAIHEQPPYRSLGRPGQFPAAESIARRVVNLPLFFAMTEEQVDHVISSVLDVLREQPMKEASPRLKLARAS
jgi:dTDP-4-amino-4,6-dideoxygalactose transaminase